MLAANIVFFTAFTEDMNLVDESHAQRDHRLHVRVAPKGRRRQSPSEQNVPASGLQGLLQSLYHVPLYASFLQADSEQFSPVLLQIHMSWHAHSRASTEKVSMMVAQRLRLEGKHRRDHSSHGLVSYHPVQNQHQHSLATRLLALISQCTSFESFSVLLGSLQNTPPARYPVDMKIGLAFDR